jgi:hypothetical protein
LVIGTRTRVPREGQRGHDALRRTGTRFDPGQLARTGVEIVVSTLFGARADFRAMQALANKQLVYDYSRTESADFWLDYVADTGDGFAPTYAVACLLARPEIALASGKGGELRLPRGRLLVMGGDEVYPTPTPDGYEERLVGPYATALPRDRGARDEDCPHLFAIPGNHDWYDGLGAFMNLFGSGQRIGNWVTPQERSYFALKLPYRTWLVAVDIQLSSDIDNAQIEAFSCLEGLEEGDRVILCTAEPDWQYRASTVNGAGAAPPKLDRLRRKLEERGASIVLQLAGDMHHYRRQSDEANETHCVTAGGGGAFLHPTHTNIPGEVELLGRRYTCVEETEFPARARSMKLSWHNWLFPLKNRWFGVTTAIVYVILGLVMPLPPAPSGPWYLQGTIMLIDALSIVAESPASMAWVLLVIGGFFFFTDTHKRWYRYLAGFAHGSAHLACALAGGVAATRAREAVQAGVLALFTTWFGAGAHPWAAERIAKIISLFGYIAALGAWGYVFGALVFGLYLWISVLVFGRHGNEAFSAIKHEGYRNFLRLRVAKDVIEVFAIGLERVPTAECYAWRDGGYCASQALAPHLIERFEARIPSRDAPRSLTAPKPAGA